MFNFISSYTKGDMKNFNLLMITIGFSSINFSENHNMFGKIQGKPLIHNYMIFALAAIIIILIVLVSYYYLSRKMEKHLEENKKLISQIFGRKCR